MKFVTILLPVKLTTPCDDISFSLRASHSKYDTTSVSYFPTGNLYVRRCAARPGRSLAKKNMNCGQQSEFWSVPCKLITAGLQNPTQHFTLSDLDWPPLQSADRWPRKCCVDVDWNGHLLNFLCACARLMLGGRQEFLITESFSVLGEKKKRENELTIVLLLRFVFKRSHCMFNGCCAPLIDCVLFFEGIVKDRLTPSVLFPSLLSLSPSQSFGAEPD